MKWICTFLLAFLWTGLARAQTASTVTQCPAIHANVRWETITAPDILLCRALGNGGEELFALTISSESPFRPQRSNRAEVGTFAGETVWWYRVDGMGEFTRETLLRLNGTTVVHASFRAPDPASMAYRQHLVETLHWENSLIFR